MPVGPESENISHVIVDPKDIDIHGSRNMIADSDGKARFGGRVPVGSARASNIKSQYGGGRGRSLCVGSDLSSSSRRRVPRPWCIHVLFFKTYKRLTF